MPESLSVAQRVDLLTKNYSSEAPIYERTWAPSLAGAGRLLLDRLEVGSAASILDVGAGTGALLPEIASRAPNAAVIGVDRSEGMIARASDRFGRAVMDASALGFRDGSFDAATLAFVIFHLPDPAESLREVRRILRREGKVGLTTWGLEETWPAWDVWFEVLDDLGADPSDPPMSQHDLVNAPGKVESLLDSAGYSEVETWQETLRTEWNKDSLLDFATGVAVSRRRLMSLDDKKRKRCIAVARGRLGAMRPESFTQVAELVAARATNPG